MIPLLCMTLIGICATAVFGADGIATPTASPTAIPTEKITPKPTVFINPTPSVSIVITPTPSPLSPVPTRQSPTPQLEFIQPLVDTPTPQPTVTPTPKPNGVASIINTPTPPPNITKSLINFPKKLLSYIAPKDVYGTSALPLSISLEMLGLGSALVVVGMVVLRWKEGDRRVTTELKQIGIALRSWLL